jgi:hypothetical protein
MRKKLSNYKTIMYILRTIFGIRCSRSSWHASRTTNAGHCILPLRLQFLPLCSKYVVCRSSTRTNIVTTRDYWWHVMYTEVTTRLWMRYLLRSYTETCNLPPLLCRGVVGMPAVVLKMILSPESCFWYGNQIGYIWPQKLWPYVTKPETGNWP